jgi:DNA-binding CsgD family transcriptional regulator
MGESLSRFEILNQKEKQVLYLIGSGFASKSICTILQLKLREVAMHRYNIKLKLRIRTNKELTALILHSNYLRPGKEVNQVGIESPF